MRPRVFFDISESISVTNMINANNKHSGTHKTVEDEDVCKTQVITLNGQNKQEKQHFRCELIFLKLISTLLVKLFVSKNKKYMYLDASNVVFLFHS